MNIRRFRRRQDRRALQNELRASIRESAQDAREDALDQLAQDEAMEVLEAWYAEHDLRREVMDDWDDMDRVREEELDWHYDPYLSHYDPYYDRVM